MLILPTKPIYFPNPYWPPIIERAIFKDWGSKDSRGCLPLNNRWQWSFIRYIDVMCEMSLRDWPKKPWNLMLKENCFTVTIAVALMKWEFAMYIPCPGMSFPESFTPASRLIIDSVRSPNKDPMNTSTAIAAALHEFHLMGLLRLLHQDICDNCAIRE